MLDIFQPFIRCNETLDYAFSDDITSDVFLHSFASALAAGTATAPVTTWPSANHPKMQYDDYPDSVPLTMLTAPSSAVTLTCIACFLPISRSILNRFSGNFASFFPIPPSN